METNEQPGSDSDLANCRLQADHWLQILAGLILPILCLILAALLSGCSQEADVHAKGHEPSPRHGGTLRILHNQVGDLDPVNDVGVDESVILAQMYEGLVSHDSRFGITPCLAESWMITSEGTLYTFIVRDGVRFHDGQPLTSEVVVRSLMRSMDSASRGCTCLKSIEGVEEYLQGSREHPSGLEALGRDTVRVRLKKSDSGFLPSLAMIQLRINLESPEGRHAEQSPVGTGPFRLIQRTVDGDIHLVRNEDYWGAKSYLDTLQFIASAGLTGEEKIARMLKRDAHVMCGGEREEELLAGKAGYRICRDPGTDRAPVGLCYIVDPRLRGFDIETFGFCFARFDKVWFAGEESLAERAKRVSTP